MGFGYGSSSRSNPLANKGITAKRQLYPTGEIAHLWAHQTQDGARNAQGNFYFYRQTIYSYSSPIAAHVENDKGERAVIITTASYSVTTSGRINVVRRAVPAGVPVFNVDDFFYPKSPAQIDSYNAQVAEFQRKAARARDQHKIDRHLARAAKVHAEALRFAAFYGFDASRIAPLTVDLEAIKAATKADAARVIAPITP